MITLSDAKQLKYGDVLVDQSNKRWKVNGKVKTWEETGKCASYPCTS